MKKASGKPQWLSSKESAMQEMRVRSPGREALPEKKAATHSRILAWRIPWTEEPGGLQSTGLQRVGHDSAITPEMPIWVPPDQPRRKYDPESLHFPYFLEFSLK